MQINGCKLYTNIILLALPCEGLSQNHHTKDINGRVLDILKTCPTCNRSKNYKDGIEQIDFLANLFWSFFDTIESILHRMSMRTLFKDLRLKSYKNREKTGNTKRSSPKTEK